MGHPRGRLHRRAPEHVRLVAYQEDEQPSTMAPTGEESKNPSQGTLAVAEEIPAEQSFQINNPESNPEEISECNSQSQDLPDQEPDAITPQESIIDKNSSMKMNKVHLNLHPKMNW